MLMILWHLSFGIFAELWFRTNSTLCIIWRMFLLSAFWVWLCTLKVCSARKNAIFELMEHLLKWWFLVITFIPLYEIVFVVNYLLTQNFRFENVLYRGATRGWGWDEQGILPCLFWKSRKKPWFWKKRPWLCPSLGLNLPFKM